ncbi:DUF5518 domain-containing protein [Halorientalis brevis]|uniref:DUF5518 domain-containing protein n=1 Tax=Halorientalis brevis TaxID=1126241 RepID=A0ABD6CGI9_9EURY|nr:DUF5518 domain-containing protein [Halorientalis brevis]
MAASRLQELRADITDESYRVAILVGIASIPFTVFLSRGLVFDEGQIAGGRITGSPLLVAGVVVGYLYSERPSGSRRAGVLTGITGSIAVVLLYLLNLFATISSVSQWVAVVALLATPLALVLGVLLCAFVGLLGAVIGDWARTTALDRLPFPRKE